MKSPSSATPTGGGTSRIAERISAAMASATISNQGRRANYFTVTQIGELHAVMRFVCIART